MDSTKNGHSEENQERKTINIELKKNSSDDIIREIDFYELPLDVQEEFKNFMDEYEIDKPPLIYEMNLNYSKLKELDEKIIDTMDIDSIGNMLKNSILEENFEEADEISKLIKKRKYSIEISNNLISLQYNE